ncbi:hypothetical protein ACSLGG_31520 (plasmid) [Bacillus mycoides]|uniref:hypothetical protein n=1 Tax=Bacillus mycoides TaxID=1405 RepID=UPI003F74C74D
MRNKNMERMSSYIVLCLIGAVHFYFDSGLKLSLQYVVGFMFFAALFELIKRLFSKKNKESSAYPLPETDERIEKLMLKISAQIFALSLFIAFVVLFVMYFMNNDAVIRVEYVLGFVFLVLFIGVGFSSKIAKKIDQ